MKGDIEDLLSLIPKVHSRVTSTTCFGLCNHSPNLKLTVRGGTSSLLRSHRHTRRGQTLVNDGGFRMRIDTELEDGRKEGENAPSRSVSSDTVMISSVTVAKVSEVVTGLNGMPRAIRAIQYKARGNKHVRDGRYEDASQCFSQGCEEMYSQQQQQDADDGDSMAPAVSLLLASLWLCCVRSRLQWASKINHNDDQDKRAKKIELLRLSAVDAFTILSTNTNVVETSHNGFHSVLQCSAGVKTRTLSSNMPKFQDEIVCKDVKILSEFCVVLADAWSDLALASKETACGDDIHAHTNTTNFKDGAFIAYRVALDMASGNKKVRIFRAKERRHIEKAVTVMQPA